MNKSSIARAISLLTALIMTVTLVFASPSTRKTKITFSHSVRVPGAVLSAGTYYFQAPHPNQRTIVRILDANGKVVTQLMGIADYTNKRNHDIVVFGEHDCGMNAIKAWFYPDSGLGIRFIYPEDEAAEIAAACKEPVPETHEKVQNSAQAASDKAYVITPEKQEKAYTPDELTSSDQTDQNGFNSVDATSSAGGHSEPR